MPTDDFMSQILDRVKSDLISGDNAVKKVVENDLKAQGMFESIQTIFNQVSKDAAIVKTAEVAAAAKKQVVVRAQANAFGVNIENTANRLVRLATEKTKAEEESLVQLDELHRQANIGITDDPLGFIAAQTFGVPAQRAKYRASAGRAAVLSDMIDKTNQQIQQSVVTYESIKEPITQASAEALTRLSEAEAKISAQKTALEGMKYNSEALSRSMTMSHQVLNTIFQVKNAINAEKQLQIAQEHLDISRQQFDLTKAIRTAEQTAKEEQRQFDEHALENITLGYQALGLPTPDAREAKFIEARFKAGDTELWDMYARGRDSKVMGTAMVGTSAANSIDTIAKYPASINNFPESRIPVIQLLAEAKNRVDKMAGVDKKDKKAVDAAINKEAGNILELQFSQSNSHPENVFNVGDLRQYLGSKIGEPNPIPAPKAIQSSTLYNKFLKPAADAGVDMSDPKIVWAMLLEGIKSNKITYEEAVDISRIYKSAAQINMSAKGLIAFGLVPNLNGKALNVKLGRFGGTINITDVVEVGKKLNEDLANYLYQSRRIQNLETNVLGGAP